jgi:hypothetical protein
VDGVKYASPVIDGAIDWFVFRRSDYTPFPPFRLGRYVWDSWMLHHAISRNWTTVTTLNFEHTQHAAYGLHWHHSRAHQNPNQESDPRKGNSDVARLHGGWLYGRLRAMALSMVRCGSQLYCITRRFDRRDCDGGVISVRVAD